MRSVFLFFLCLAATLPAAAQNRRPEAVLRFDEAVREELAEPAADTLQAGGADERFAVKINRRWVSEAEAYDRVTLWNVRRVRLKQRRLRLADSTARERVTLLKFFIERDRRKGMRPHLQGNVAGYSWNESRMVEGRWQQTAPYISRYLLRSEVDSARRAGWNAAKEPVPKTMWHPLPHDLLFTLDGRPVPGKVFQFIDGLILRTLNVVDDGVSAPRVEGDIYPDRRPVVLYDGRRTTIDRWLALCSAGSFQLEAAVPMRFYYILPLEAVERFGPDGLYGAIEIHTAE